MLKLEKWNFLGNDFLISHTLPSREEIILLSNRNFGLGCDQFIYIQGKKVRFFNSDGSESGMCGNGLKCVAQLIFYQTKEKEFELETLNAKIKVKMEGKTPNLCLVMPLNLCLAVIPFELEWPEEFSLIQSYFVDLGNPHLVFILNKTKEDFLSSSKITSLINKIGSELQGHFTKTNGINVSFVIPANHTTLEVRTYERGVGETLSCGSGSCASFLASVEENLVSREAVKIFNKGSREFFLKDSKKILEIEKNYHLTSLDEKNALWLKGEGVKIAEIILN